MLQDPIADYEALKFLLDKYGEVSEIAFYINKDKECSIFLMFQYFSEHLFIDKKLYDKDSVEFKVVAFFEKIILQQKENMFTLKESINKDSSYENLSFRMNGNKTQEDGFQVSMRFYGTDRVKEEVKRLEPVYLLKEQKELLCEKIKVLSGSEKHITRI